MLATWFEIYKLMLEHCFLWIFNEERFPSRRLKWERSFQFLTWATFEASEWCYGDSNLCNVGGLSSHSNHQSTSDAVLLLRAWNMNMYNDESRT